MHFLVLAAQDPEAVSDGWLVILGAFLGFVAGRVVFGRRATFKAGVAKGQADASAEASAAAVVSVVATGGNVHHDGADRRAVHYVEHQHVDHRGVYHDGQYLGPGDHLDDGAGPFDVDRRPGSVGELLRGADGGPAGAGGADDGRGVGAGGYDAAPIERR